MALHPPQGTEKLIFAPSASNPTGSANSTSGAAQFTQHESAGGLHRRDLNPHDPIAQFHTWFKLASAPASSVSHPETCTLSTASLPSGRVSARMVYLKELDARGGFVLYSNFGTSQKAADLFGSGSGAGTGTGTGNPWAALTFWWEAMERQVRVEGRAVRLTAEESSAYFNTRVRGSRIGAWSSRQSERLRPPPPSQQQQQGEDDGRSVLDGWVREREEQFRDQEDIPVPDFWGGLRIVPERIEFWQGRQNRLHDRFVYDRVGGEEGEGGQNGWTLDRLSP